MWWLCFFCRRIASCSFYLLLKRRYSLKPSMTPSSKLTAVEISDDILFDGVDAKVSGVLWNTESQSLRILSSCACISPLTFSLRWRICSSEPYELSASIIFAFNRWLFHQHTGKKAHERTFYPAFSANDTDDKKQHVYCAYNKEPPCVADERTDKVSDSKRDIDQRQQKYCRQDYNHHDDSKQSDCFLYNVEA